MFVYCCYSVRAQVNEAAYREVANEKVELGNKLRDCRRKLSRVEEKLATFDSREDNLRDLRRQASEFAERADEAQALAEARVDAITKEAATMLKEKECAEKRYAHMCVCVCVRVCVYVCDPCCVMFLSGRKYLNGHTVRWLTRRWN